MQDDDVIVFLRTPDEVTLLSPITCSDGYAVKMAVVEAKIPNLSLELSGRLGPAGTRDLVAGYVLQEHRETTTFPGVAEGPSEQLTFLTGSDRAQRVNNSHRFWQERLNLQNK